MESEAARPGFPTHLPSARRPWSGSHASASACRPRVGEVARDLVEAEEQGDVAADALGLEDLGGLDALPGGRDLDEDPVLAHPLSGPKGNLRKRRPASGAASFRRWSRFHLLFVEGNDLVGLGDGSFCVEGKASIDLGTDISRNYFGDLSAEGNSESVGCIRNLILDRHALGAFDCLVHKIRELRIAHSGQNKRGIRRRIDRLEFADAVSATRYQFVKTALK